VRFAQQIAFARRVMPMSLSCDDVSRLEHYTRGGKKGIPREVSPQMNSHLARLRKFFGASQSRPIRIFKPVDRCDAGPCESVNSGLPNSGNSGTPKNLQKRCAPAIQERGEEDVGHAETLRFY